MVQIPDSLRKQLAPVLKHRFWILAALVPLVLLPALFMAVGGRRAVITAERARIDGQVSSLNGIRTEPDHPNEAWSRAIDARTAVVKKDLLREWAAFWQGQKPLRIWPEQLGADFQASAEALESGGGRELQFRDLQRYQNTVPDIVRGLAGRMGAAELMPGADGMPAGFGPGALSRAAIGASDDVADDPEAVRPSAILEWKADDQARLLATFTWEKVPSTTQVVLAQEELWAYGLFCDAIRKVNAGATALFDSRITTVEQLAVGYPAAEDKPGGHGTGRILAAAPTAPGMPPDGLAGGMLGGTETGSALEGGAAAGPLLRPQHPRFSGGTGMPAPGMPAPEGTAGPGGLPGQPAHEAQLPADDLLKEWIYVDAAGRPLTAQELGTSPDAKLVHRMPFVLRVIIDQRQVDRLLAELATSPVPIDVRQVRINPPTSSGGSGFGGGGGLPTPGGEIGGLTGGSNDPRRRPFDVTVELRGTVGLATPPNPAVLGPPQDEAAAPGDGGA